MGLFGAVGALVGGFGLFKGGSGVRRAAKSLASDTGRTMAAIREDVREIKEHLIREVWPRVNDTLDDVQAVLKETQTFVTTGTFTVKVLALLLIVCALYIIRKQRISLEWHRNAYRNAYRYSNARVGGNSVDIVRVLEGAFLQFLFWACLLMAVVLVLHLVREMFHVANVSNFWPTNIPFIIIIPSAATALVVLQHLTEIVHTIASAILLLFYGVFGLPVVLVANPVSKGSCYTQTSKLLTVVVIATTILLYIVTASFPVLYLWEVYQLKQPVLEFVLLVYLVFFATAIAINIMGEVMLIVLIKPLWSFMAKSHYD